MSDLLPPYSLNYIFFVLYLLYRLFFNFLSPKALGNYYKNYNGIVEKLYSYFITQPLLRLYLLSIYCAHEGQKDKDNSSSCRIREPLILDYLKSINPITEEDKKYARDFSNSDYAIALANNPNYIFDKQDIEFTVSDEPVSAFTDKLLKNYNYLKIDSSAVQCFREGHDSFLTGLFTSSPMYKIESVDKEIVRKNLYSYFALGIVSNKNYKVEPVDLLIAKQNPESYFAMALEQKFNFKDKKVQEGFMQSDKQNSQTQITDSIDLNYSEWFTINSFAKSFDLSGGQDDNNAQKWHETVSGILSVKDKIEGEWYSRWNREDFGNKWVCGIAHILRLGNMVYILHKDTGNVYLIEAQLQDEKMLIGKYTNLGNRLDSMPWIGLIVDGNRIDGKWPQGRWDFCRKRT